jgi:glycerol-3-phosphate dehydrogenase
LIREEMIARLQGESAPWDVLIVGGGATGLGAAVDASSRGYRTALVEQHDFAKATSSRATKLVHGGVRYLEQGNLSLVVGALRERGRVLKNAPHLAHDLQFVIPAYKAWQSAYYGFGLRVYGLLAGRYGIAPSRHLGREAALGRIPTLRQAGLRGGILYHDGQFDDARLAITLAQTAADHGAALVNYARVEALTKENGKISGARVRNMETNTEFAVRARVVINATGVFTDAVRRLDEAGAPGIVVPSQGVHLVFDRKFVPGDSALMVPKTDDGRVMFAIPWHGRVVVGTTDTEIDGASLEPRALPSEIEFLLRHAAKYLDPAPRAEDVRAVFAGLRPLVKPGGYAQTAKISRDHFIGVSAAGLVTITGGKWTTYRRMAQDTVNKAAQVGGLDSRPCTTHELRLHASVGGDAEDRLRVYGSDARGVRDIEALDPDLAKPLSTSLNVTGAQIVWAARREMARTVEDALARRTRCLFLDAREAAEMAPAAARLLAKELGRDPAWEIAQIAEFRALAAGYLLSD